MNFNTVNNDWKIDWCNSQSAYLLHVCRYLFIFTSFCGHRPTQRECAQTGLTFHVRFFPYPLPVKVGHTTGALPGSRIPTLFEQWCGFLKTATRTNQWKCCEMWPMVFCPYLRIESLTIILQMSLQKQQFLLSYLKTLSVSPAGVWIHYLPLGTLALSQLS